MFSEETEVITQSNVSGFGTICDIGVPGRLGQRTSPLPARCMGDGRYQIPKYFYDREADFWGGQSTPADEDANSMQLNYLKALLYYKKGNFEEVKSPVILSIVYMLFDNPEMTFQEMMEIRSTLVQEITSNGQEGAA